jgi:peroxiredoxin
MDSVNLRSFLLPMLLIMLAGCGNMMDDLNPSNSDKRPREQVGTIGTAVGQNSPDFTLSDTLGNNFSLSSAVSTTAIRGVVLYFAMEWCPICEGHIDSLRSSVIPSYQNIRFYVVDYTCGTIAEARAWELATGFDGSGFSVLADTNQNVLGLYQATMGSTIVIDNTGVIRMNEDYKDGTRLLAILASLP